ncbi:MAG TPA: hypothetical protein VGH59_06930 [Casimicrobiaceae bacterium]|jgi:hypothetical protein
MPLELGGRADLSQLDHQSTRRRLAHPGLELQGHESDRHGAVFPGRDQQFLASPLARRFVLERHLVETRQCVSNVRLVVDRQPSSALRVDVRERAVGQLRPLAGIELAH